MSSVLALSTLLTALYYLRVVRIAFFRAPADEGAEAQEVDAREAHAPAPHAPAGHPPGPAAGRLPLSMQAPLVIAAALSLAFGLYPAFLLQLAGLVVR